MGSKWPPLAMEARGCNSSAGASECLPEFLQAFAWEWTSGGSFRKPQLLASALHPQSEKQSLQMWNPGAGSQPPVRSLSAELVYLEKSGCGCSLFPTKCELHPSHGNVIHFSAPRRSASHRLQATFPPHPAQPPAPMSSHPPGERKALVTPGRREGGEQVKGPSGGKAPCLFCLFWQ